MKSTVEFNQAILLAEHTARVAILFWFLVRFVIIGGLLWATVRFGPTLRCQISDTAALIERLFERRLATRHARLQDASKERSQAHTQRLSNDVMDETHRLYVEGMKKERFRVAR
jgi:hypothetical protein